jgi:hypothetical protein
MKKRRRQRRLSDRKQHPANRATAFAISAACVIMRAASRSESKQDDCRHLRQLEVVQLAIKLTNAQGVLWCNFHLEVLGDKPSWRTATDGVVLLRADEDLCGG